MTHGPIRQWDRRVAEELGCRLAPRTLTLKHVHTKGASGTGFCFLEIAGELGWVDIAPVWRDDVGVHLKPLRLLLPPRVKHHLQTHRYHRWYFVEGATLYPVQTAKVEKLWDEFWFVPDPNPLYRPILLMPVETLLLRRKALTPSLPPLSLSPP